MAILAEPLKPASVLHSRVLRSQMCCVSPGTQRNAPDENQRRDLRLERMRGIGFWSLTARLMRPRCDTDAPGIALSSAAAV